MAVNTTNVPNTDFRSLIDESNRIMTDSIDCMEKLYTFTTGEEVARDPEEPVKCVMDDLLRLRSQSARMFELLMRFCNIVGMTRG